MSYVLGKKYIHYFRDQKNKQEKVSIQLCLLNSSSQSCPTLIKLIGFQYKICQPN